MRLGFYRYNAKFNKINNIEKAKKDKINLINIKIYQVNKKKISIDISWIVLIKVFLY